MQVTEFGNVSLDALCDCPVFTLDDFLKKGFNTYLGNISFEFYLIHYPLIFGGWPIIIKYDLGVSRYLEWGIVFFVLSIIMAQIAHCISKKYKGLLQKK